MATKTDAHGGAHTAVPADHKGPFPPFQKETFASQLVWLAIFFVALYVMVSRMVLPRVGGIIEARQGKIEGDLAEAQRLRDTADKEMATYEQELAAARARAQTIGGETRDRLMAQAESERKALDDTLAAKLADAEKQIAATRATAMNSVRGIATEAAKSIVERLTGSAPDAKAIEAAVDAASRR